MKTSRTPMEDIPEKATTARPSSWKINLIAKSLPLEEARDALDRLPEEDDGIALSERRDVFRRILDQLIAIKSSLPRDRQASMEAEIARLKNVRRGDDYLVFPRGRKNTLLVFPGAQGVTGGVPIEKSHWFTANIDANVIYMMNKSFGLQGDFGTSNPNGLDNLRSCLDDLGTRDIYVLGFSGGCFAAIRAATGLAARRCAAFNPRTRFDEEARQQDGRVQGQDRAVQRLLEFLGGASPYLDEDISGSPQTRIDLYFASGDAKIRRHVEYISKHPNVFLCPIDLENKKGMVVYCMASGEYMAALNRLFEVSA